MIPISTAEAWLVVLGT